MTLTSKISLLCIAAILLLLIVIVLFNYERLYVAIEQNRPGVQDKHYVQVFSEIYATDEWQGGSGPGSNPQNAAPYMTLLQQYFYDPRFNVIVDLGCGDWQIMRNIQIPDGKKYLGFDVVPSVIETNERQFTKSNVGFYHITGLRAFKAKNISGDLLIVKDVMQHWPFSEIEYFIMKILPNFKYALITNQYEINDPLHNRDMPMGPYHSLGLLGPPFNLRHATPIMEYDGPDHKQVLLYVNPSLT
ncbi:MAG TPA: class I SAM-dependent methyltransferase [Gammaproteobacteria bacterium]|nr:class I SAM-dependent methyltransferase [Gammaproteobacteria bacterium]